MGNPTGPAGDPAEHAPAEVTTGAPRVSIVMPAYNAERMIESTLRSLAGQSFRDFEVIVVDDGSKDGTADVVERFTSAHENMRLIRQENTGTAGARNRGISEARGEFIALLDQDDHWHDEKLALQVAYFDSHPDVALVSCYSALVDEDGRHLGWRFGGRADREAYRQLLEWDFVSGGSVAMMRRRCLDEVGPFDTSLPSRSDWSMWIRLARRYPVATVPRVLVFYTRSAGGSSRSYERMLEAGRAVLDRAFEADPALPRGFRRFCEARDLFAIACFCAIDYEFRAAWKYLGRSLRMTPLAIAKAPRRWAFTASLLVATIAPRRLYEALLGVSSRLSWGLTPGRPFDPSHSA